MIAQRVLDVVIALAQVAVVDGHVGIGVGDVFCFLYPIVMQSMLVDPRDKERNRSGGSHVVGQTWWHASFLFKS